MMKNFKLKLVVLNTLSCLASGQALADWENLPETGVSVGSNTSAYIICNPTGNFGSGSAMDADVQPTSIAEKCALVPQNDLYAPDPNYIGMDRFPKFNNVVDIVVNNTYTNNTNVTVGTLRDYVWRRSIDDTTYECIYGMKVVMNSNDYNLTLSGTQYFEINDVARKGWVGKTLDVAYSTVPTNASSTYRIGRTFTSVTHSYYAASQDQPLTGLGSSPAITSTQKADLDSNWIDFTIRTAYVVYSPTWGTSPASGMQYIRTDCTGTDFSTTADAIRLRQTSRAGQPPIEIEVEGFLPN